MKNKYAIRTKVIVRDATGTKFEGTIVNINDYREPDMKYAVDLGLEDLVFVGEESIEPFEKGGAE